MSLAACTACGMCITEGTCLRAAFPAWLCMQMQKLTRTTSTCSPGRTTTRTPLTTLLPSSVSGMAAAQASMLIRLCIPGHAHDPHGHAWGSLLARSCCSLHVRLPMAHLQAHLSIFRLGQAAGPLSRGGVQMRIP